MKKMISFDEGLKLVLKHTPAPFVRQLPVEEGLGHRLLSSVFSPSASPPFDQSAMDGYAFRFADYEKGMSLQITEVVPAGEKKKSRLRTAECVRIFTGAALPAGADTVVMQEKTEVAAGTLHILDQELKKGSNVRLKGSHVLQRAQIGRKDDLLTAPLIAYFSSVGVSKVPVIAEPRIAIIVTGDELVSPGKKLQSGQVYECNSSGLSAAFRSVLVQPEITVFRVKDRLDETVTLLKKVVKEHDLIVLTGGVSVGDFDFVLPALETIRANIIFHKIRQKPGKPVCLATLADKMIFGLPGNPASVLTCFYTLVVPALSKWAHGKKINTQKLPSCSVFRRKPGLTQFLKAEVSPAGVLILEDQESYKLNSFARANALVKLPENVSEVRQNTLLDVWLLPL